MILRRLAPAAAALTLLAGLTACGDDTPAAKGADAGTTPSASASEASDAAGSETAEGEGPGDPAEALRAILQAYVDGDADFACSRQTQRYTDYSIEQTTSLGALPAGASCADTVRFSSEMAKKFKQDNAKGAYEVASNDGSTASVVHDQAGTPVTYTLKVEDGVWKIDGEG